LTRRYSPAVRILNYSGSGIETTFTQGEDACLTSFVAELPEADGPDRSLLVVGALPDIVEDQFRRLFADLGIAAIHFLPPRRAADLPPIGQHTHCLLAQPFLCDTARALEARGARIIPALFPIGSEGTTEWLRAAADCWGIAQQRFEAVTGPGRARASAALARHRAKLDGKRIFFFPDSQLEVPLARFLCRELGMRGVEIGTPYLHKDHLEKELALLPDDVRISEGQDVEIQLDRCRKDDPDLVVCGLGLANPLEAEGITTKWSIELLFTPIQGYDQAGDAAELFTRPLARHERLEV
jgi:light-independent protochlorophyllide reductase subunit N